MADTATAIPVVSPIVSPTPVTIPTETQAPTSTPTSPNPTPTAFVPASGAPDNRYAVIATSAGALSQVASLGVNSYIDFSFSGSASGSGANKVIFIRSIDQVNAAQIQNAAIASPGATWYVLGEANVAGLDPNDIVVGLHDIYNTIKASDPTAKITSPSILNYEFTCILCGGYQSGKSWIQSFITGYSDLYGSPPPVDYWAIDVYPIIWDLDQLPTTRSDIALEQISDFRQFLNTLPSESSKPIVVTEIGLHWGFSGMTFSNPECSTAFPSGEYQTEKVIQYLREIFNGLEASAITDNIHSWYLFSTYRDLTLCHQDNGYGLTLFESPDSGATLSPLGQFFYNWIRGTRN
ncbi:hypothetical protein [Candidatus Lucifugimonas marina]|uniref:hypothetical protein n=1 Tax=Candidatus Lucifugimonas marina TaxID=3038979 RepID=UPI00319E69AE